MTQVSPPYFDLDAVRRQFPALALEQDGKPLVYLDNAATAQKPEAVLRAIDAFYRTSNANIHRGVYRLSVAATDAYDKARASVARFLNAASPAEIVFTRGATESINLVAQSFGRPRLRAGDEVLMTPMEHHANFVPWQQVAADAGARIRLLPLLEDGSIDLEAGLDMIHERTAMLALCAVSNSLGTINPARRLIEAAHARGIPVLLDGAQAVVHGRVDVQALDCDFLAFSGHKLFGPTGIGVLYGKAEHLRAMPPYQLGGDMIDRVRLEGTTFADPPERFEAGTPDIAGAVGLAAAIAFLEALDFQQVEAHELRLLEAVTEGLCEMDGIRLYGTAEEKIALVSFVADDVHPHDLATFLDVEGVAVRAGHHCCQPLMAQLGIPGTTRASFAFYNTLDEVDIFLKALHKTLKFFR